MATLTPALTNGTVADADAVMALLNALNADLGLPKGLTGATQPTRYVGGTATGAPTTGTFAVGDYVIVNTGGLQVCTVAGTPGTWVAVGGAAVPVGSMVDYGGTDDPADTNWLLADGRALSRSTYSALFAALCSTPGGGTVTITLASPGVFTTATAHKLKIGDPVWFTTTGNLPTGLSQNLVYYVLTTPSTTTFTVSATVGGAAVNTSVGQSGTHTVRHGGYGIGDGSTTFNLPDTRGRVVLGPDDMGTAQGAASRLPNSNRARGLTGGEERHTLTTAELAAHSHTGSADSGGSHAHNVGFALSGAVNPGASFAPAVAGSTATDTQGAHTHTLSIANAGSGTAHNVLQPYVVAPKLIRVFA